MSVNQDRRSSVEVSSKLQIVVVRRVRSILALKQRLEATRKWSVADFWCLAFFFRTRVEMRAAVHVFPLCVSLQAYIGEVVHEDHFFIRTC